MKRQRVAEEGVGEGEEGDHHPPSLSALYARIASLEAENEGLRAGREVKGDLLRALAHVQGEQRRADGREVEAERVRRENEGLRGQVENVRVLYEQIERLTARNLHAEQELRRCAAVQVQLDDLVAVHQKWQGLYGELGKYGSADQLESFVLSQQRDKELLLAKAGELESTIHSLTNTVAQHAIVVDNLQGQLDSYKDQLVAAKETIKRQQLLNEIHRRERDDLKQLFDASNMLSRSPSATIDAQRIVELEKSLLLKDQLLQQLTLQPQDNADQTEKLTKENRRLNLLLSDFEKRLTRGDYDPSRTKVLHMINNPANLHFMSKDQPMQTKLPATVVSNELAHENESLKRTLASKTKEHARLVEICQRKITEFRDTVFLLFGYKIDCYEDSKEKRFTLTSRYAKNASDQLLFIQTRKAGLELVETNYAATLSEDIKVYLGLCNSIPAFLGNLTITLLQQQPVVK